MSYETDIIKALTKFGTNSTANPDSKNNVGGLLGEAFMWDKIAAFAEARSDACWNAMVKEGIVPDKKTLQPGEHHIAQSPSFACFAKVTNPIKRFSGEELATLLAKSKYKVPISTTKELIDQAKVPTSSTVTFKIVERS